MAEEKLPYEWGKSHINDIATVVAGGTPKAANPENFTEPGTEIAWLTPADLSGYTDKYIKYGARDLSELGYNSSSAKLMPKGTLLFSSRAPIGYVAIAANEISTNQGFKNFIFTEHIDASFAYYYLRNIRNLAESLGTGTTFKEISGATAKTLPFIIVPLSEQKIIAQKLDILLPQVNSIKVHLEKISQVLKQFRQSVLNAAVSGKLTEEWKNNNYCELSYHYIARLDSERERLKTKRFLKKSFGPRQNAKPLFANLPKTWMWVNFEHIARHDNNALKAGPFGSALKKSDCVNVGYKVYGQEQVISGNEALVTYYVTEDKYRQLESCAVEQGDILISLVGTIGKVLILSDKSELGIINPRLVKLSLQKEIDRKYIKFFLESSVSHGFFKGFSHGGTMDILNLSILKELSIPFPPLEEQTEIVRRVEKFFAWADSIENQVKQAQLRVNNLTQSILAKAFRGELTEQWRKDNPELISGENSAEALLAKIKAERELAIPAKRSRKKS
ncbi:restriction endonuclease subunit S [Xenorhabdus bovienii]|uniref:restriction endonuclease subunit S n=1 Tax=Xenorhabdus bovienii TaxID=40576 RepID=UPI003DA4632A